MRASSSVRCTFCTIHLHPVLHIRVCGTSLHQLHVELQAATALVYISINMTCKGSFSTHVKESHVGSIQVGQNLEAGPVIDCQIIIACIQQYCEG